MQLLQDGVVAALAAVGLTTILFLLVSVAVHPRRRGCTETIALIPVRGEEERLAYTVRALTKTRHEEGGFSRIVIVDGGMGEETAHIAAILCREESGVSVCAAEELEKILMQEREHGSRDDDHRNGAFRRFPE